MSDNDCNRPAARGWSSRATAATVVAQQRLRASGYPLLRDVRCEANADAICLRGRVPSFYFKQLAQELVRSTDSECSIVNQLEVRAQNCSANNIPPGNEGRVLETETHGSTEAEHGSDNSGRG